MRLLNGQSKYSRQKNYSNEARIVCRLFTALIDDSKNEFDTSDDNQ